MSKFFFILLLLSSSAFISACGSGGTLDPCDGHIISTGDVQPAPSSVFILAGQSNANGYGIMSDSIFIPKNIVIWVGNHWEKYNPNPPKTTLHNVPNCFGPDLAFLTEFNKDNPDETVGLIKLAVGSTSMGDWNVTWTPADASPDLGVGPLYTSLISQYKDSGSLPVRAFLWMQGESDANSQVLSLQYKNRIETFINSLREVIGQVPFVFGETQSPVTSYLPVVQNEQIFLSSTFNQVCLTDTHDLETYEPYKVHFTTDGNIEFGSRLYNRFLNCK